MHKSKNITMVTVELINHENRFEKKSVLEAVSNVIFGSQIESEFSEKYVPSMFRVPNPKVSNFTKFLINVPKCFWVVYYEETIVGFVLISDSPHPNSIGFSINSKFAQKGVISAAWDLIKSSPCINYPLYARTSQRNFAAMKLLDKLGFRNTNENFLFGDEPSFKLILD
jgi:hypothetical protein